MTTFENARTAGKELQKVVPNKINRILKEIADEIDEQADRIIEANLLDLKKISEDDPTYDFLCIDRPRLESYGQELREVAAQPSPLGKIISSSKRPNEMIISKVTVPYGVIGVIFESRPAYTLDSFALCLKSGNAVVLKSSFEAHYTNTALVKIIKEVLADNAINPETITLLKPETESAISMLRANGYIDLAIPRGSQSLVQFVRENAYVPVIETSRGVSHTYIDSEADLDKATAIIHNAKTRLPSSSNS